MLGCVTQIGLFFKYSTKRAQLLDGSVKQENLAKDIDNRISSTKIKLFHETRWIERHVVLEEMYDLYDPLLKTLCKINTKYGWDNKTADAAYSLIKRITNPPFIVALNVCYYTLGFSKPLSMMLQATSMDIIKAYTSINLIQSQMNTIQADCDKEFCEVWRKASEMHVIADTELTLSRICRRMTNRSKGTISIPIIDHLVAELDLRFSQIQVSTVFGMYLIPKNTVQMIDENRDNTFKFFEWALPSPHTFNQELGVWRKMCQKATVGIPSKLASLLETCNQKLFPNIYTSLHLLMIIPVSTAATEHSQPCL